MRESWKVIEDHPRYEVSNMGNVRNKQTQKLLHPYDDGNGTGGYGGFGGDWGSLIVLFLIAAMFGGFGNGFGGGFGGGNGDFPWLMSGQAGINANTNGGFRDAMLQE